MRFDELLSIVGHLTLFETGTILVGRSDSADVRRQLSRWVAAGKVLQVRRGVYTLAPPYRRVTPEPFFVANHLILGSYVSLQAALSYHGMIPETVYTVTSVTHRRARNFETPLGTFTFRHVRREFFAGYDAVGVLPGQKFYVATREKALADLIHLTPSGDDPAYLQELRLNLSAFRWRAFARWAQLSPRVQRALPHVKVLVRAEADFERL